MCSIQIGRGGSWTDSATTHSASSAAAALAIQGATHVPRPDGGLSLEHLTPAPPAQQMADSFDWSSVTSHPTWPVWMHVAHTPVGASLLTRLQYRTGPTSGLSGRQQSVSVTHSPPATEQAGGLHGHGGWGVSGAAAIHDGQAGQRRMPALGLSRHRGIRALGHSSGSSPAPATRGLTL